MVSSTGCQKNSSLLPTTRTMPVMTRPTMVTSMATQMSPSTHLTVISFRVSLPSAIFYCTPKKKTQHKNKQKPFKNVN